MSATASVSLKGKVIEKLQGAGALRARVIIETLEHGPGVTGGANASLSSDPITIEFEETASTITDAFTKGSAVTVTITQP